MDHFPLCLFCDQRLSAKTKPEHIILDALGGRRKSRRLICDLCNGRFGSTIDRALAESVQTIRNMLSHPSGTGKPAPAITYSSPLGSVRVDAAGRPTMKRKPFTVERSGDAVTLDLRANGQRGIVDSLRHAAAHLGCSPIQLLAAMKNGTGPGLTETYERAPSNRGQFSLGTPEALRSIVKTCLELTTLASTNEAVRGEPFAAARAFVLGNLPLFNVGSVHLDDRALPNEASIRELYGPAFHLVYVSSNAVGRTIGYFRLYGIVAWQTVLAEEGGPLDIRAGIACDPLSGVWSDKIGPELDLSGDWLEAVEFDGTASAARAQDLMQVAWWASFERETDRIIRGVFEEHGIRGEAVVEDQASKDAIFAEIADRIAQIATGVALHRSANLEKIEGWLAEGS